MLPRKHENLLPHALIRAPVALAGGGGLSVKVFFQFHAVRWKKMAKTIGSRTLIRVVAPVDLGNI